MNILSKIAASFILIAMAHAARAMPSQIMGEGAASCNDFLTQPDMQSIRLEWVLGYISGRNAESPAPASRMTGHTIHEATPPMAMLETYCRANNAHPLIVAADTMRMYLQQNEK